MCAIFMAETLINLSDSMITESVQWPCCYHLCCKQCWRAAVVLTQLNVQPSRAYLIQVPTSDVKNSCERSRLTLHAMILLMCHTHYTLTQPKTLGLIDNTLLNKNLTNVMDVHCILNAIFNGKQTRRLSSMVWPRLE